MLIVSRRDLLAGAGALGLARFVSARAADELPADTAAPLTARFRFVHMTDLHIQPELGATEGVQLAVKKLLSLRPRPDFILTGGDHVMDVLASTRERADLQFRLLAEALKPLEMPVYATVGNHDVYGWSKTSPATETDPGYGIQMFEERFAKRPANCSFEHKGWHFVVLNSIQADGRNWTSRITDDQLSWLQADLERAGKMPTVLMTHVPVMSIFTQYSDSTLTAPTASIIVANGKEVQALLAKHNVRAVLQGHTHVVEDCEYLGTRYITGGAVSGEWWKGPRLGVHPEGFMVYDVDGARLTKTYTPYGWKARA